MTNVPTPLDRILIGIDNALRTVGATPHASRPYPAEGLKPGALEPAARRLAGALMRVNHVGEVCAQALYQAQALSSRDPAVKEQLDQASRDETDHLAWTARRLSELGDRPSLLNPLWYAGAFAIGLLAGRAGDAVSLGFVVETEQQVERHLAGHLDKLPPEDRASRAIVAQMQQDEAAHAEMARSHGAQTLPAPARFAMRLAARAMTTTAHYV